MLLDEGVVDEHPGVGRITVQYVNCLQIPDSQPEHAINFTLNAMNLTHKIKDFIMTKRG